MKHNITIRKANIKDLKDILRLSKCLFRKEYKEHDKSLNLDWAYNEGKQYFRDRITKRNGFVNLAEIDNEIIGYLCGGLSERLFYRKKAKYAELENMLVEKKFRGKGIGERLTADFLDWCTANKVDCISVTASAQNKHAIDFYRKIGFKDYNLTLEIFNKSKK